MNSLYKQYIVVTLCIICGSLIISMFFVNGLYNVVIRDQSDTKNFEVAQDLKDNVRQQSTDEMTDYFSTIASLGYQITLIEDGEIYKHFGTPFSQNTLSEKMLNISNSESVFHGIRTYDQHFSIMNHYANDIKNTVGVPIQTADSSYYMFLRADNAATFTTMHYLIVGFLLVTTVIILIAMTFFARQFVTPLKKLQKATTQIAEQNFDIDVMINRKDELGQLAAQFQKMAQQLAENDRMKKEFMNNVSHDFQSPLLNIQGYATVLKNSTVSAEQQQQYLSIIEQETQRLSSLTKQLLLLSSLDQKTLPIEKKTYALHEQLAQLIRAKRWLLEERQLELVHNLPTAMIKADPHLMEQVWDNLLSNAIRYSEQGKITVAIHDYPKTIEVHIQDEGIGIEEEHLKFLTERFYQVDKSRNRQSSGLGLAIVDEIVSRHDGSIHISSTINTGTKVCVILPKL